MARRPNNRKNTFTEFRPTGLIEVKNSTRMLKRIPMINSGDVMDRIAASLIFEIQPRKASRVQPRCC
jgi:hypothetical protein